MLRRMSTSLVRIPARLHAVLTLAALCFPVLICLGQPGIQRKNEPRNHLCFISDTQEPLLFDRLYLSYNSNAAARTLLFKKIYELNPISVFHLGDLVFAGSSARAWNVMDEFVKTLRDEEIDFFPIPGNHEYYFFSGKGIARFVERYPYASLTGYSKRYSNLVVILLNSNFDKLSQEERELQMDWYRKTLHECEADTSIGFVIVTCHHSPFTNSKIVSSSEEVRDTFVKEFYKFKKCKLFISGHAHAYEHFQINGKDFLVIGGGGGIQQPLKTGKNAEYRDLFSGTLKKRMFHFLEVGFSPDSLTVELNMLKDNFQGFEETRQLVLTREKQGHKEIQMR